VYGEWPEECRRTSSEKKQTRSSGGRPRKSVRIIVYASYTCYYYLSNEATWPRRRARSRATGPLKVLKRRRRRSRYAAHKTARYDIGMRRRVIVIRRLATYARSFKRLSTCCISRCYYFFPVEPTARTGTPADDISSLFAFINAYDR